MGQALAVTLLPQRHLGACIVRGFVYVCGEGGWWTGEGGGVDLEIKSACVCVCAPYHVHDTRGDELPLHHFFVDDAGRLLAVGLDAPHKVRLLGLFGSLPR